MLNPGQHDTPEPVQVLGECHPLLEQLGAADGLYSLSGAAAALRLPKVESPEALLRFLRAYKTQVLLPLELPAICRAHHHARRNEARELVELDLKLAKQGRHEDFASASLRVGRSQLRRLRPLRDERVAQRYLEAVEGEQAHGWHTVVYGLTLAIYSLPVRQGLLNYGRQTLRGFIQAAARSLRLSPAECAALLEELCAELPARSDAILNELALTG